MTREEAIQVLTDIKRIRSDVIAKAIDMAIEALSADTIPIEKYHELQHQFVMLGATFSNLTEVVRCKDCDNTVPHWYMLNGKRVDCNWCVEMESEVDDDEYCSRAVPKGTRAKMKGGGE